MYGICLTAEAPLGDLTRLAGLLLRRPYPNLVFHLRDPSPHRPTADSWSPCLKPGASTPSHSASRLPSSGTVTSMSVPLGSQN